MKIPSVKILLSLCTFSLAILAGAATISAHGDGGHGMTAEFTKHFNRSLFRVTEHGEFSIEILLDEKEYAIGKGVFGIVVHDRHDEDVEGAGIEVTMTGADGRKESFAVKEKGRGLYTVPSPELPEGQRRELRIGVKTKSAEDAAVFVFPDDTGRRLPAGKHGKGQ